MTTTRWPTASVLLAIRGGSSVVVVRIFCGCEASFAGNLLYIRHRSIRKSKSTCASTPQSPQQIKNKSVHKRRIL